jgi:hypothetical protein
MNLVSETTFRLLLSAVTGGLATGWVIYDLVALRRLQAANARDPIVADKRFGHTMGIVIEILAIVGTLRFNGVL